MSRSLSIEREPTVQRVQRLLLRDFAPCKLWTKSAGSSGSPRRIQNFCKGGWARSVRTPGMAGKRCQQASVLLSRIRGRIRRALPPRWRLRETPKRNEANDKCLIASKSRPLAELNRPPDPQSYGYSVKQLRESKSARVIQKRWSVGEAPEALIPRLQGSISLFLPSRMSSAKCNPFGTAPLAGSWQTRHSVI